MEMELGNTVGHSCTDGHNFPLSTYPGIWNNIIVYIIYFQWLAYLVAAGFLLRNVIKSAYSNAAGLHTTEKFWLMVFLGNWIVFLGYIVSWAGSLCGFYITGAISFSLMLYLTIGFSLYGAGFEYMTLSGKPEKRKIAEDDAMLWIEKLDKAVLENDLYKDPHLKLNDLARKINISGHQLSQLLNDNLGKSFSTFINEYRIREACKLIAANSRLTFEAIGYEVGYNSKSTFYAAFRKIKDTTPAIYKEGLEKQLNN